jgi:Limiting CO2-inducible proteins B/C beta carbonyic anhydrases
MDYQLSVNFQSGFPFAGNTGFGAMSAHIPDNGNCLIVFAPHVGITQDGVVGKVERAGIKLVDTCCGSAIAANNYLKGITDGGAKITTQVENWSDFQQGAVQQLILPHAQRLKAAENRMVELPYALYTSQDVLLQDIVESGKAGLKKATAILGGIQINTSPGTLDYFHPLRFEYMDNQGNKQDLLPLLTAK